MKSFGKWTKKKWVSYTIATCSAVVLYMVLSNIKEILAAIGGFFSFLKPVSLGIITAYVFHPLTNLFFNKVFVKITKKRTRWKVSVAVSIIVLVSAIVLLGVALIPQLADSVSYLANNMGSYLETLEDVLNKPVNIGGGLISFEFKGLASATEKIVSRMSDYFADNMDSFVTTSANIGKGLFDSVLGLILAIYFLLDKHRIITGLSKFFALFMKKTTYDKSAEFIGRCNDILIRYISFDIVDGIIVGIVNLIFMLIMGMPYSVLISVIVGVTNLAPTFGPIVGAVFGSFILVLVNPWDALWFLIFTLILQTVDGYVLKPKLFGGSLGVSPLMILIAIVLGGRLFGVPGILLAIPFAAIFDIAWKDFVVKKLEEKKNQQYNI